MKLLIEIETRDVQTLADAKGLIDLYMLALSNNKEAEAKPEPKPTKPKPEPETEVMDELSITLTDLKRAAKQASDRTDRDSVLKVIKRYGGKLAEVTENNYAALLKDLEGVK